MSSDKNKGKKENDEKKPISEIHIYESDEKNEKNIDYKEIVDDPEKFLSEERKKTLIAEIAFKDKYEKEFAEKRINEEMELRSRKEDELLEDGVEKRRKVDAEDYAVNLTHDYGTSIDNLDGLLEHRIINGNKELENVRKWLIPLLEKENEIYHNFFYEIKLSGLKKIPRDQYKKSLNPEYLNALESVLNAKEAIEKIINGPLTKTIQKDLEQEPKDKSLYRTLNSAFDDSFKLCEKISEEYRAIDSEGNTEIKEVRLYSILQELETMWGTYMINFLTPHVEKENDEKVEKEESKEIERIDMSYL